MPAKNTRAIDPLQNQADSMFSEMMGQPIDPMQGDVDAMFAEEIKSPGYSFGGGLKTLAGAMVRMPENILAKGVSAIQGPGGASAIDKDWGDRLIGWVNDRNAAYEEKVRAKYGQDKFVPGITVAEVAKLSGNLGYTGVTAGAGIGVGLATGAVTKVPAVSWGAGMATVGALAQRMASYEIMQEFLDAKNDEMKAQGREITADEEASLKAGFSDTALANGLWEAIPEAIGSAVGLGILIKPLAKMGLGKHVITRILGKLGALYGEELTTETITQMGQQGVRFEAGLPGGKETDWSDPGQYAEALKEVAPQTMLLTTVAAGGVKMGQAMMGQRNPAPAIPPVEDAAPTGTGAQTLEPMNEGLPFAGEAPPPVPPGVPPVPPPEPSAIQFPETVSIPPGPSPTGPAPTLVSPSGAPLIPPVEAEARRREYGPGFMTPEEHARRTIELRRKQKEAERSPEGKRIRAANYVEAQRRLKEDATRKTKMPADVRTALEKFITQYEAEQAAGQVPKVAPVEPAPPGRQEPKNQGLMFGTEQEREAFQRAVMDARKPDESVGPRVAPVRTAAGKAPTEPIPADTEAQIRKAAEQNNARLDGALPDAGGYQITDLETKSALIVKTPEDVVRELELTRKAFAEKPKPPDRGQTPLIGKDGKKPSQDRLADILVESGLMRSQDRGKKQYEYAFRKTIRNNTWMSREDINGKMWKPGKDAAGALARELPKWAQIGLLDRRFTKDGIPVYAWKGTKPAGDTFTENELEKIYSEGEKTTLEAEAAGVVSEVGEAVSKIAAKQAEYDSEKENKIQRMEDRAAKAKEASQSAYERSRSATAGIPMGQPILVGHHSEGKHRAALKRSDAAMRKSIEEAKKAEHYQDRAEAAESGRAISSDDPGAVTKLTEKIKEAEDIQALMKAVNKIVKSKKLSEDEKVSQIQTEAGFKEETARELLKPDFVGRIGFPSYKLTNNNANIRRMKQRLGKLEKQREEFLAGESVEIEHNGIKIIDNVEDNRVQIFFDGKPDEETRKKLKSRGFRWARRVGAWQRQRSGVALREAKTIVGATEKPAEQPVAEPKKDASGKRQTAIANRLRTAAGKAKAKAEEKYNQDRNENTARRARMAQSARDDAASEIQIADAMLKIADGIESGEIKHLGEVRAKTQVASLFLAYRMERRERYRKKSYSEYELHKHDPMTVDDIGHSTFDRLGGDDQARLKTIGIKNTSQLHRALKELVELGANRNTEDPLKAAERAIQGQKVGIDFFPTTKTVINQMLDEADIQPGMKILEPSAGKGDIADGIKEAHPDVEIDVVEISHALREILKLKGYDLVESDFMDLKSGQYDRIVMNPPFSKSQDIKHIQHAFELLKPGGRIVAIMGEGAFFRSDKSATGFREWLAEKGTSEKLPEGSFKGKEAFNQTGVNSRIVVVEKPAEQPVAEVKPKRKPRAGTGPTTIRGAIKKMGGINFGSMKGELRDMPLTVQFMANKTRGLPWDTVERALKDTGWMLQSESLLDLLRSEGEAFLVRGKMGVEGATEARGKPIEEWEPEEPPAGEYVIVNAEDLPEGKTLTIIDGNPKDGWDTYRVIEKDPFGITLEDGRKIELSPLDKVQVLKKDIEEPALFEDMVKEARRWKGAALNADAMIDPQNAKERLRHSHQTTKGRLDDYLKRKFGIDDSTARSISNELTSKNIPADRSAKVQDFKGEPWADAVLTMSLGREQAGRVGAPVEGKVVGKQAGLGLPDPDQRNLFSTRYSYVGKKAKTADKTALNRAVEMEQAGELQETIRQKTGWFLGLDNKWRYEISDENFKITGLRKTSRGLDIGYGRLGKFTDHPKLFEAYPELADLRVRIEIGESIGEKGQRAAYFKGEGGAKPSVTLRVMTYSMARRALLHEVQHATQEIEGFATGGSPAQMQASPAAKVTGWAEKLDSRIAAHELTGARFRERTPDGRWLNSIEEAKTELANIKSVNSIRDYNHLAGEIESRDTGFRAGMTEDQRKVERPYRSQGIKKADAIVRFGSAYQKNLLSGITLKQIQALPIGKKTVEQNADGTFEVSFPNGKGFKVVSVESITAGAISFEVSYRRPRRKGEDIAGSYDPKTDIVRVVKGVGDAWTITHEFWHFLIKSGLVRGSEARAIDRVSEGTGEEAQAKFIEENLHKRDAQRSSRIRRILQKIADILDGFVNLFRTTARGVVRGIEKGKIQSRETGGANEFAQPVSLSLKQAAKNVMGNPAFRKWFGKSKVVDEAGEPLVVYHGTSADFLSFDPEANTIFEDAKGAMFFTTDPDVADTYLPSRWYTPNGKDVAKDYAPGSGIMPVYAKLVNPMVVDYFGGGYRENEFAGFIKEAKKDGHDGVVFMNVADPGLASAGRPKVAHTLVAFHPTQIKSIYNRGTFSERDPNIMYQVVHHGTPHIWPPEKGFPHGRPRLDKIGTGEGAAAYGWGWYSAQEPTVAEGYRARLGSARWVDKNGMTVPWNQPHEEITELARKDGHGIVAAERFAEGWSDHVQDPSGANKYVKRFLEEKGIRQKTEGATYALDIPDSVIPKLLDWDKPVPVGMLNRIKLQAAKNWSKDLQDAFNMRMENNDIANNGKGFNGQNVYKAISNTLGSDREASRFLADAGIPGNTHGGVSGGATGKKYVIWDQKVLDRIALLKRNGEKLDAIREAQDEVMYSTREAKEATEKIKQGSKFENIQKESGELFKRAKGIFGRGFIDNDMKWYHRAFGMPYWLGEKFKSMKTAVQIEIRAVEARAKLLLGYYDGKFKLGSYDFKSLGEYQNIIGRDKKKTAALEKLIWENDRKRFDKNKVPENWFKEVVDAEGIAIELNDMHYKQVYKLLTERKIDSDVVDAYIALRRQYDQRWIDAHDLMLLENVDATDIEEYRASIGKLHNYFPHRRTGNAFIAIYDTRVGKDDPETATVFREHFNSWNKILNRPEQVQARTKQWLRDQIKAGELTGKESDYKISEIGKVTELSEEVFFQISPSAMQQVVDAAAGRLKGEGVEELRLALSKAIADVIKSRGWGRHAIQSKNIPGFETGDVWGITMDYMSGFAGFKTKMTRAREHQKNLRTVDAKKQRNEYEYLTDYVHDMLSNQNQTDRVVDGLRGLFFAKYLGFVLKSGFVNLTQNIVLAAPTLSLHTKGAHRKLGKAMIDVRRALTSKEAFKMKEVSYPGLSEADTRAVKELHESGASIDQFLRELKGDMPGVGWSKYFKKGLDWAGLFMGMAEKFNRTSTGLAAFRIGMNEKGMTEKEAIEFAKKVIYYTHFLYGQMNLPSAFRGGDINKVLRSAYTFRTFTHNYLSAVTHLFKNEGWAGKKAVAVSLRNIIIMGGLTSIPFFKALSEVLLWALDDDDEDAMTLIRKQLPHEWMKDIATYGLPGVGGFDLTGSLSIEVPRNWADIAGVPYSIYEDTANMIESAKSGATWRAVSETPFTPIVMRNAMRGFELWQEGQRTRGGKDINYPGEAGARKITTTEALKKALLGLQPTSVSSGYKSFAATSKMRTSMAERKTKWADRLVNAIRKKDDVERKRVLREISEWNRMATESKKFYRRVNIRQMIRSRLKMSGLSSVPRSMRGRALEISDQWKIKGE